MIEYNDYVVVRGCMNDEQNGRVTASITLPCFKGDENDFEVAVRLNVFYTYAAGVLYSYAASISDSAAHGIDFVCRSEVVVNDADNTVEVTLHLTERRTYRKRKSDVRRKTLSHLFIDGYAVRRQKYVG